MEAVKIHTAQILQRGLEEIMRRIFPGAIKITGFERLTGGAIHDIWGFEVHEQAKAHELILRRAPKRAAGNEDALRLEDEAEVMRWAHAVGVPVPGIHYVLQDEDGIGRGIIMDRAHGETLARKILRDREFAHVRPMLAGQTGHILATLHGASLPDGLNLRKGTAQSEVEALAVRYDRLSAPRPVFEYAFRWLRQNMIPDPQALSVVHGDFRNGNFVVDGGGICSVLDWELAHFGDPMEDLGWICLNSWRFGKMDKPVGGFGSREDLFAGYKAAGRTEADPKRVHFWEVLGTLRWGVSCARMTEWFRSGADWSVERAMIARRASETEIDLLWLLSSRP